MPLTIRATHAMRPAVAGSLKSMMPSNTVPTAPMPVHTAYAVPTGRLRIARPSRTMLITIAATVPIDGKTRVKPSVYLSPMAQPISNRPAITSRTHAIYVPFLEPTIPKVYARSAPVDDALCLANRSLDCAGLVHLDGCRDPDPALYMSRELRAQRRTARRIGVGRALDVHRERIQRTHTRELELVMRRKPRERED